MTSLPRNLLIPRVATDLGMKIGKSQRWGPCPSCGSNPKKRPPVYLHHRDTAWTCSRCEEGGDAIDLISFAIVGTKGRNAGPRFQEVVAWLEERGTIDLPTQDTGPEPEPVRERDFFLDGFRRGAPVMRARLGARRRQSLPPVARVRSWRASWSAAPRLLGVLVAGP